MWEDVPPASGGTRRGLVPSDSQYTWEPRASQMTVGGGGGRAGLGDTVRLEVASRRGRAPSGEGRAPPASAVCVSEVRQPRPHHTGRASQGCWGPAGEAGWAGQQPPRGPGWPGFD